MSKVFISYSTEDEEIARKIFSALQQVGADTFLASISIKPGSNWTREILNDLEETKWVFFIATKSACCSSIVQQELGVSLAHNKHIIPLLIDISPNELPGLIKQYQAIDVRTNTDQLRATIDAIGQSIHDDKFWSGLILGVLILVVITYANK